jgi:hypothetical protein
LKAEANGARNRSALWACAALFALNAFLCWPLFRIEYLDNLQSNEGVFLTHVRYLLEYWPHIWWFPWFDAGMASESAYQPLLAVASAALAFLTGSSPGHAVHFLVALTYSLAPVFLFLLGAKLGGLRAGLSAGLLWTLFSPSVLIPSVLADSGSAWVLRRLYNIVRWGEVPHNVSLAVALAALLLLARYLERPNARRFAAVSLGFAAVSLTNAFGAALLALASVFLWAARDERRWRQLLSIGAVFAAAYLLICRAIPPSLLKLMEVNSQLAGGDFRYTPRRIALGALFASCLVLLWFLTRRLGTPLLRFSLLFFACFGGIAISSAWNLDFIPQPLRYQLEMEIGACLLAGAVFDLMVRRLPRRAARALIAASMVPLAWVAVKDYRFARGLVRPLDPGKTTAYRQARWIGTHLPGQRVMVSGDNEFVFNLFADNPQLSAGHEPSAPNWMSRVAVYVIYSGQNAGDQDGPISVLWLKAFGCGAVTVPGPQSRQTHPVVNPAKFDGLLPLVWREEDDSVYRVPLRSTALAHVVPGSAIVSHQPIHGLDVGEVRRYVAALEDPDIPASTLAWSNPEQGRITATVAEDQVISLQVTYDPGWEAAIGGKRVAIHPDGLGLMVIQPDRAGPQAIDLRFTGGAERLACLGVSLAAAVALLGMLFRRQRL